ncbi:MAG: ribosome small subunit-dependent GTPase A [Bacilli bacterium]|nr:ribosome small subunit-dependent GTPase A [Bacilli bacterium]MDD4809120.1 ribosome small subunit-dependent GTPase A [Bacilli bacterium]
MQGKIIKIISNDYTVKIGNKRYICKARGKFRKLNITPLVGDNVMIDIENNYILEVLPRHNELNRPTLSNIDQVIIMTSVKNPNLDLNLLDKLLTIIEYNNILPIICLSKLDLLDDNELIEINNLKDYYEKIGYQVYTNTELAKIKSLFKDKVSVFTGQSGSGKSTLLNRLDKNLNIETNEISMALGRGKHTTRHVELLELYGGLVADTPGFSAVSFTDMNVSDIRDNFIEFNEYRDDCEYRDCMHKNETKCEIKNKVEDKTILSSRYENYLKFIDDQRR